MTELHDTPILPTLDNYKCDVEKELCRILEFWQEAAVDEEHGGSYGRLDNLNSVYHQAPKGSVLNSRILWTFSAAYRITGKEEYLNMAERVFQYIIKYFIDDENGGVYWSVDYLGNPLGRRKQIYALSFAIYGLSEFYRASKNERAKEIAVGLFQLIVAHSYDTINGGYIEAFTVDWKEIKDLRLSEKDANEKKSMNTHLHLLEAFTNLYRIWPNEDLKKRITELLSVFIDHIIDPDSYHLILFFDEQWNKKSDMISYGHDIEAAWLLQEAAELIGKEPPFGPAGQMSEKIKLISTQMAQAAAEGIDKDGGLWYEYDAGNLRLVKEKHWWPQAEAMVGFFNAWQHTGDDRFLQLSLSSWNFVQQQILDKKNGEWFWGVHEDNTVMNEDKVGIWKCPYHNGRACIELISRINKIVSK